MPERPESKARPARRAVPPFRAPAATLAATLKPAVAPRVGLPAAPARSAHVASPLPDQTAAHGDAQRPISMADRCADALIALAARVRQGEVPMTADLAADASDPALIAAGLAALLASSAR